MSEAVEYIEEVGGIYFRSILLEHTGSSVPQHEHDHDHATLVASGGVLVWADDAFLGHWEAPRAMLIRAGVKHTFQATEDDTRLVCVHVLSAVKL